MADAEERKPEATGSDEAKPEAGDEQKPAEQTSAENTEGATEAEAKPDEQTEEGEKAEEGKEEPAAEVNGDAAAADAEGEGEQQQQQQAEDGDAGGEATESAAAAENGETAAAEEAGEVAATGEGGEEKQEEEGEAVPQETISGEDQGREEEEDEEKKEAEEEGGNEEGGLQAEVNGDVGGEEQEGAGEGDEVEENGFDEVDAAEDAEAEKEKSSADLSDSDRARYRQIFERRAVNDRLDLKGFKILFRLMGEVLASSEAEAMFDDGDKDDNGTIDFDEFCRLYSKFSSKEQDRKEAMLHSIDKLFPSSDGEPVALKKVEKLLLKLQKPDLDMRLVREKSDLNEKDVRHLVHAMDTDGNGLISKQEFVDTLCQHLDLEG